MRQKNKASTCCQCKERARYQSDDEKGYCLRHWQVVGLTPGRKVAGLHQISDRVIGGGDRRVKYWILAGEIIDPKKYQHKLKPLKGVGFIYVYRPAVGKACQMSRAGLLPIGDDMPKVKISDFADVYQLAR